MLRRFRLALAHTKIGLAFVRLHRSIQAQRRWLAATSVLRIYCRGLRRLHRRVVRAAKATRLQAAARAMAPRRAFVIHAAALYTARRQAAQAALERRAASCVQAHARGNAQRRMFREELRAIERRRREPPAATALQAMARGKAGRREHARRRAEYYERLVPSAVQLQGWWRVCLSERMVRKWRSVVERHTAAHLALVRELQAHLSTLARDEAQLAAAPPPPPPAKGAKRFEMWVSLRVGIGAADGEPGGGAFGGSQVFSVRAASLKGAGTFFRAFFSDQANVDANRDADGHYLVPRSSKHFATLLEFMRDGSCELPCAYVPSTYDNRAASSEEQELREFLHEASFYGLRPLVESATTRLLTLRYGGNGAMMSALRAKGLLA